MSKPSLKGWVLFRAQKAKKTVYKYWILSVVQTNPLPTKKKSVLRLYG